jgi:hypothetical protein
VTDLSFARAGHADIVTLSDLCDEPTRRPRKYDPTKEEIDFSTRLAAILTRLPNTSRIRLANALYNKRIYTLKELCALKLADMRKWKNVGKKSIADLVNTLTAFGLALDDEIVPIVVPDQSRPIDAHVQVLHRWIDQRLTYCASQEERGEGAEAARARVEREVLTDVMRILDGRPPDLKYGLPPDPRDLYDLCASAFGTTREDAKTRITAASYGKRGKAVS